MFRPTGVIISSPVRGPARFISSISEPGEACRAGLLGIVLQALELEHLQPGPDVGVEVEGVDAEAGRRAAEPHVRAPFVGDRARRPQHAAHDRRLAPQRLGALAAVCPARRPWLSSRLAKRSPCLTSSLVELACSSCA